MNLFIVVCHERTRAADWWWILHGSTITCLFTDPHRDVFVHVAVAVIRTGGPPRGARGSNGAPNRGYGRPNSGGVAPPAAQQAWRNDGLTQQQAWCNGDKTTSWEWWYSRHVWAADTVIVRWGHTRRQYKQRAKGTSHWVDPFSDVGPVAGSAAAEDEKLNK